LHEKEIKKSKAARKRLKFQKKKYVNFITSLGFLTEKTGSKSFRVSRMLSRLKMWEIPRKKLDFLQIPQDRVNSFLEAILNHLWRRSQIKLCSKRIWRYWIIFLLICDICQTGMKLFQFVNADFHVSFSRANLWLCLVVNGLWTCMFASVKSETISNLRFFLPRASLKTLYYTLIYPYLHYGNIVWGGTYHIRLERLRILQKKVIRIITNSPYRAHTNPLFKSESILKIDDINILNTSTLMYLFHTNQLPQPT